MCVPDWLRVVEANIGINKANAHTTRALERQVSFIGSSQQKTEDTIHITNKKSGAPEAEDYTSYIRLYYPAGTEISSVFLDDTRLPLAYTAEQHPLVFPFAQLVAEEGRVDTVIGIGFSTPLGATRTLRVVTHRTLRVINPQEYELVVDLQVGVGETPISIQLFPPSGQRISHAFQKEGEISAFDAPLVANDGYFEYNRKITSDSRFRLLFEPL